jgi:hypothetical protein
LSASLSIWRHPLTYLTVAALLAGAYFRFNGLGSAPFAVDEYYLGRSIENVLRTGFPGYPCGGLYMRGILLQYSSAGLQLAGLTGELAPRLISVICGLLALPALYLIARRQHDRIASLLPIVILALSVWEIETVRFGRMYGPFQAVFLWYMLFFLRYTVDRDKKALWPMLLLSILGPLVWEGGVFLPLTNLLSLFIARLPGPLKREDLPYLISCGTLLVAAALFVTADFRGYTPDSWPPGYTRAISVAPSDVIASGHLNVRKMHQHVGWLLIAVTALGFVAAALRPVWQLRTRPFLAVGLLVMLLGACGHQFVVVAAIALLLLLTRVAVWSELFSRALLWFWLAIGGLFGFWLAYAIAGADWPSMVSAGWARVVVPQIYLLFTFPDLIGVVIRPWGRAVPHLGIALLALMAVAYYRATRWTEATGDERAILVVFLVLLLAASASHPPRQETRYEFFLFPLAILIGVGTILGTSFKLLDSQAVAVGIASVVILGGFALSEDFLPRHLLYITTPEEMFRRNMNPDLQSHLVARADYRSLANWLKMHRAAGDVVVDGVHGFDHYYPDLSYFYVEQADSNFPDWTCRRGTVERWSNLPLLSSVDQLTSSLASAPRAYLVAFAYRKDDILNSLAALHPEVAAIDDNVVIIQLKG